MGCCQKCIGFLTDREQRKVWRIGILYVLSFPILLLMIVVGSINAREPGEDNPNCRAEPNLPWFLIIGGVGISFALLVRIALTKCVRYIKTKLCDETVGCFCELGLNMIYDTITMIFIIMWLITVSWWVMRHRIAAGLYSAVGKNTLDSFRSSLGDNDTIYNVQFSSPDLSSYCNVILYEVAFVLLSLGWVVLLGALVVFIVGKVGYNILCCRLCLNIERRGSHLVLATSDGEFEVENTPINVNKYRELQDVQ